MAGLLEGVIPAVLSGGNAMRQRVKGLLSNPRGFFGDMNEDLKTVQDQTRADFYQTYGKDVPGGLLGKFDPAWVQQQAGLGRDQLQNMALNAMTVWHGSPHKFDKFDMSKIGTGEGNQSYGRGLYFAENPTVAKEYAKLDPSVMPPPNRLFQGKELTPGSPEYHAGTLLERASLAQARKEVAKWIQEGSPDAKLVDGWKKTLDTLNKATSKKDFKVAPNTNLYKVDLPDEAIAKMLDWDAPLSKQPESVRGLLRKEGISGNEWYVKALGDGPQGYMNDHFVFDNAKEARAWALQLRREGYTAMPAKKPDRGQPITGGDFVKDGSPFEKSEYLKSIGIPGIRYLDGGSRGAGQGTRNFVVFDDQLPKILERNGQGLLDR
jgi:hypothetical protein